MDYKKKYYKYKTKYLNEVNQKGGNDNINCFICNKTNSKDNLKCWNCSYLLKSLQQQMVLVCPTCGFNNKQTDTNCIIDGTSLSGIILTKSKYCPLVEKTSTSQTPDPSASQTPDQSTFTSWDNKYLKDITDDTIKELVDVYYGDDESKKFKIKQKHGNIETWNVSKVKFMSRLFASNKNINNLDLSKWDVSNVKVMNNMFYDSNFSNINSLKNWNIKKVTNLTSMFENCQNLINLYLNTDLDDWDVRNVITMHSMFKNSNFHGNLEGWNNKLGNLVYVNSMFFNSKFNGNIDNWRVFNVKCFDSMFENNKVFTGNLSNWDVRNGVSFNRMFYGCTNIQNTIQKWKVKNVTFTEMFYHSGIELKTNMLPGKHLEANNYFTELIKLKSKQPPKQPSAQAAPTPTQAATTPTPQQSTPTSTPASVTQKTYNQIWKEKIPLIHMLRIQMKEISTSANRIDRNEKINKNFLKDYVKYHYELSNSNLPYNDMIKNLEIKNINDTQFKIDGKINYEAYIKHFLSEIFNKISVNSYPYSPSQVHLGINRFNHGSLNHMRSVLFCLKMVEKFKNNSTDVFNKLFSTDKQKKLLTVLILSSIFKSLLRIDETGGTDTGYYVSPPEVTKEAFDDTNNSLKNFNGYETKGDIQRIIDINNSLKTTTEENNKYMFVELKKYDKPVLNITEYNRKLYENYVSKNYTPIVSIVPKKIAIIMFGNPGSGKGKTLEKCLNLFNLRKENFIKLDPDELRLFNQTYIEDICGITAYKNEKNLEKQGSSTTTNITTVNVDENGQYNYGTVQSTHFKPKKWKHPFDSKLDQDGYVNNKKYISIQQGTVRTLSNIQSNIQDVLLPKYISENKNIIYDTSCSTASFCKNDIFNNFKKAGYHVIWCGNITDPNISKVRARKRSFIDGRYMDSGSYLRNSSYTPKKYKDDFGIEEIRKLGKIDQCSYVTFTNNYDTPTILQYYENSLKETSKMYSFTDHTGITVFPFASSILLFSILKSFQQGFELSDDEIAMISYASSYYINFSSQKVLLKKHIDNIIDYKDLKNNNILKDENINSLEFKMIIYDLFSNIGHYMDHCRGGNGGFADDSKSYNGYRVVLMRNLARMSENDDAEVIDFIMKKLNMTMRGQTKQNIKSIQDIKSNCINKTTRLSLDKLDLSTSMSSKCCLGSMYADPDSQFVSLSKNFEKTYETLQFTDLINKVIN